MTVFAAVSLVLASCAADEPTAAPAASAEDETTTTFSPVESGDLSVLDTTGRAGITSGSPGSINISAGVLGDDWQQDMLTRVNAERAKVGIGPLSECAPLEVAAQRHSDDMLTQDFFSHTGSDGSDASSRALDAGYGPAIVGENIAAGFNTVASVMDGWIGSPGHFATLTHPDLEHVGFAIAIGDTGFLFYWTQVFGGRGSCGASPQPGSTPATEPAQDSDGGATTGSSFTDVGSDSPFFSAITTLADQGILGGFSDGTFRPSNPVSRQAMASFLWKTQGAPSGPFPDPGFSDVPPEHPFATPIAWMVSTGLANGFDDGTFRPLVQVSRQATAAFLWRIEGTPATPDAPSFIDVGATHPFRDAIGWVTANGIASGFADQSFRPADAVSRQATASFLDRWLNPAG